MRLEMDLHEKGKITEKIITKRSYFCFLPKQKVKKGGKLKKNS